MGNYLGGGAKCYLLPSTFHFPYYQVSVISSSEIAKVCVCVRVCVHCMHVLLLLLFFKDCIFF